MDIQNEVWKDVIGYEGLYQISNFGRVKSFPKWMGSYYSKEKILTPKVDKDGYENVGLCHPNNKRKYLRINRLVASAFIENPNNLPQVNHNDGNKKNNFADNLEWASAQENVQHAWDIGLKEKARTKASEFHGHRCKLINIETKNEINFNSHRQLSFYLGYNRHWLSSAIRNGTDYMNSCLRKGYIIELEG
jgi:hypothetical protein